VFRAGRGNGGMSGGGEQEELGRNLIQRVNLADSLRRCAALYPDKVALTDALREVTYRELHEDANRVARGLLAAGIRRGGFVGLLFRNCIDYFRVYFGCARIGAVALPLNPTLTLAELSHIAREAGPVILVAQGDYSEVAGELCQRVPSLGQLVVAARADGEEPALPVGSSYTSGRLGDLRTGDGSDVEAYVEDRDALQCIYTSGTTAKPKGVITSHVAAAFTALSVAHHVRITEADVGLVVLPVHHVGGLNDTTIPHIVAGARVVLLDGWDAVKAAEALEEHSVTDTALTAPMWIELINLNSDNRYDWTAMKTALFSIASLPPERSARLRELCPSAAVLLCSGQTEFTGFEECQRPGHQFAKPLAWGDPTLMTDVGIMDDRGNLLPPHEIGEIVYRGPQAMTEYFGHAELTAESFKFGWFHSGDLGYLDDDRTVFFVDRKKDMIKTGGENVASVDVTHVILAMDGVADCAVVGLPHGRWTEAVTAFVEVSQGASITPEEVILFCKERMAGYKVPKKVLLVPDLPRTASGKVQKVRLRERFADLYTTQGVQA
jgi:acyl-CoA synthetase (AMP-forming)/AMP-acid ligase II